METLTLTKPDDMHLHLREGDVMRDVLADSARQFARAIIMPNLNSPVVSTGQALAYRQSIIENLPEDIRASGAFEPLMTLYLTEKMTRDEIIKAKESAFVHAVKYYPAGATTNSDSGVTAIENVYPLLEAMAEQNLPLLVHGEVTDADVDIFDREAIFIEKILSPLMDNIPDLRIVFEHVTTKDAVDFVKQGSEKLAATITPQHLLLNRNALFAGGLRPHHYCLPVLKAEEHRRAVVDAATSGNPKFFLGTDSAPHARAAKESACGCAGIYSAHNAIELYVEVFEEKDCLDKLEGFASRYGAKFYGLPGNEGSITLEKNQWQIPDSLPFGESEIIPFRAGETCQWKMR
ncbi:MAG: dihydroorotase [Gammaproteobacteria bacterium]|nr:MAG: dihydroorotase [Gammaproteobacteria bacterium]